MARLSLYFFLLFYSITYASPPSRSPSPDMNFNTDDFLNLPDSPMLQYSPERQLDIPSLMPTHEISSTQNSESIKKRKRIAEAVINDKLSARRVSMKFAQRRFVENLKVFDPERLRKINKIKYEKKKQRRLTLDPKVLEKEDAKKKEYQRLYQKKRNSKMSKQNSVK